MEEIPVGQPEKIYLEVRDMGRKYRSLKKIRTAINRAQRHARILKKEEKISIGPLMKILREARVALNKLEKE